MNYIESFNSINAQPNIEREYSNTSIYIICPIKLFKLNVKLIVKVDRPLAYNDKFLFH